MKRDDRRVQPSIETLEDRTVPAGNVAAGVIGGSLIVIGDAQANDIKIQASFGAVAITAGGATTVNGAKSIMLYGFKGHANIDMGGGNDFLTVGPLNVPGILKIQMGAGDDALSVVSSNVGKGALIDGGDGNDSIMVGGSIIKGNSTVSTGAGNDTANVLGSAFGRASLVGDQGDLLGVSGSMFGLSAFTNFKQTFKAALPTAMSKTVTVAKSGSAKIDVASDAIAGEGSIDKGSVTITKPPQFGIATANADGTITYVNGGSGSPTDSIKYQLKNIAGALSNEATISIAVTGANVGALGVTVSPNTSSPTKTSPIPFTATFSDDVTGFDASDILVVGGTVGTITPTNARTYAFTVNPSGQGQVSAQVKVAAAKNASGTENAASNVASVVFDSVAPSVTLNPLPTNLLTPPPLTGTVLEPNSTVTVVVNGNITLNAVVNGLNWSAAFTSPLPSAGAYPVTVTATDPAGNTQSITNNTGLVIDQTPPTTTITSSAANPTNLSSIPITIKFLKPVTEFVAGDISVSGGTLGALTGSGDTYNTTVTPTADGTITVSVAAGVAKDAAGNTNTAATPLTRVVDRVAPALKFQLPNLTKSAGAASNSIILAGTFDDASITNSSSVTFKIMKGTTPVDLTVNLFDKDAPANVANFFNYLSRYEQNGGLLLQRLVTNFVLQGGGYHFDDATNTISAHIAVDDPVRGEFSAAHSNLKGTLALALSTGPNSGTSEWFFNLANNSASLDGSGNGGPFTVFGQVAAADLGKLDDLNAMPVKAVTPGLPFNTVPLVDGTTLDENNIVRIVDFQENNRDDQLTYSDLVISNTNAVSGSLGGFKGNTLTLNYLAAGSATVSFTVKDKAGNSSTMSFTVNVT